MKFYPVGAAALLVELDDRAAVLALHAEIERRRAAGWAPSLTDVIPAARTILLDGVTDRAAVERELRGWDVRPAAAAGRARWWRSRAGTTARTWPRWRPAGG